MTKRDVAVWFCRVWALAGLVGAAINLMSGLIGWRVFGGGNPSFSLPSLALYGFVWLFATGIGTELAAEGEHGAPITSGTELSSLLVRCVGLGLFLSAALSFSVFSMRWGYDYFFGKPSPLSSYRFIMPYMLGSLVQSITGFLLAFTPRIRQFVGK